MMLDEGDGLVWCRVDDILAAASWLLHKQNEEVSVPALQISTRLHIHNRIAYYFPPSELDSNETRIKVTLGFLLCKIRSFVSFSELRPVIMMMTKYLRRVLLMMLWLWLFCCFLPLFVLF